MVGFKSFDSNIQDAAVMSSARVLNIDYFTFLLRITYFILFLSTEPTFTYKNKHIFSKIIDTNIIV